MSARHSKNGIAQRSGDSDRIWIIPSAGFYPVTRGKKGVESLDEIGVSSKQARYPIDHTGRIYPAGLVSCIQGSCDPRNLRSTLKVFHDVEETIVDIWRFVELDLDLIKVAQSILDKGQLLWSRKRYWFQAYIQNRLLTLALCLGRHWGRDFSLRCCSGDWWWRCLRWCARLRRREVACLSRWDRACLHRLARKCTRSRSTWWAADLLCRRACSGWVTKQAIWPMDSPWSHSYRLVQVEVVRCPIHRLQHVSVALTVAPSNSVLLFFDLDLTSFSLLIPGVRIRRPRIWRWRISAWVPWISWRWTLLCWVRGGALTHSHQRRQAVRLLRVRHEMTCGKRSARDFGASSRFNSAGQLVPDD